MSDNTHKIGNPDRQLISISEDYEVRNWSKKFGCTPGELTAAVKAVGNSAKAVKARLQSQNGTAP